MPVGGYDAAFLHQVDKDLECSVCLLVLKEPIQTVCGHLLCKSCCENITQNGQFRCPLCKGLCKQTETFLDRNVERKILCLEVRCDHHKQGCKWTGNLGHLEEHMAPEGDCQAAVVPCDFAQLGCTYKGPRSHVHEHMDSSMKGHITLLLKRVTQQDSLLEAQKQQLTLQEGKISEQHRTIARLERIVGEVARKDSTNDGLSASGWMPEAVNIPGTPVVEHPFEWRIEGWPSKLAEARMGGAQGITSQSFYTGCPGYKFYMTVYPNGRKEGKGSHVAVYVALLRGDFDDELQWPFKGSCHVSILDQENRGRTHTRAFDARALLPGAAKNFDKPTSSQNEGRGWQKYISHGELISWPHLTRHDSLVLQFECIL